LSTWRELSDRIRAQIPDLDRVVQRALAAWDRLETDPDEHVLVDSAALNLHGFYSGIERIFELIARHVDRSLPTSGVWHRELIQQMTDDLPTVRPAVISTANAGALDELRRFRHLVRNVYTLELVPARMDALLSMLPDLWPRLRAEILAFADFVDDLARVEKE
jgi:hypothetical protein